jgi:hypothetical protein
VPPAFAEPGSGLWRLPVFTGKEASLQLRMTVCNFFSVQFFVDKIERLFYFQADPLVAEAVKPIKIIDIVGTSM